MQKKQKTKALSTKMISKDKSAIFIPAGLILGIGLGFAFNNLVAGMFIGLGGGMVVFAILAFLKK